VSNAVEGPRSHQSANALGIFLPTPSTVICFFCCHPSPKAEDLLSLYLTPHINGWTGAIHSTQQ
jgi:hypothetical protein